MFGPFSSSHHRAAPMWFRAALPIFVTLLLFLVAIFLVYLPAFRGSLLAQRKQAVQDLTTVGEHVLQFYYLQEKKGVLTREAAQRFALEELAFIRYGPAGEDYYWVLDYEGVLRMHPFRRDLVGKDERGLQDFKGKYLFSEFINATKETGDAFVDYYWQKAANIDHVEYKLSYVKRFPEWGWIVGTGLYMGDVEAIVMTYIKRVAQVTILILAVVFLLALWTVFQGIAAGRRIRESEARLRSIFDQTFYMIVYLSLDGIVLSANKPALNFSGAGKDNFFQKFFWDTQWWDHVAVSQEDLREVISEAAQGKSSRFEAVLDSPERGYRLFDVSVKPVCDNHGDVVNVLVEARDITELKEAQAELEKLNQELEQRVRDRTRELEDSLDTLQKAQRQLVESEKMASLGGLVAGVAHEINTPLGLGVTSISFLEEKLDALEKAYSGNSMKRSDLDKFLGIAREAVNSSMFNLRRAAQLIQSFKQVAVDQTSEALREFDVKEYLEEVLASLRPKYKRTNHTVTLNGESGLRVKSYPGALTQVIANLLVNSLLHGFEGIDSGEISISVCADEKHVEIVFADNGRGMTDEQRTKIFEPFFTTRRGQGGSGLGMHIVYNLVHQKLGGTIVCESEPEKGAIFTIRIPADMSGSGE